MDDFEEEKNFGSEGKITEIIVKKNLAETNTNVNGANPDVSKKNILGFRVLPKTIFSYFQVHICL